MRNHKDVFVIRPLDYTGAEQSSLRPQKVATLILQDKKWTPTGAGHMVHEEEEEEVYVCLYVCLSVCLCVCLCVDVCWRRVVHSYKH